MNRIFRNTIFYLLIFLVVIGIVSYFNGSTQKTTSVSYDKFITKLESGEVRNVQL
ncbi:ATP-dependent metallopeptidase FtsH/Yme1/Tma family protein, partial [Bacillus velezensis]